jgi:hypothetical protein
MRANSLARHGRVREARKELRRAGGGSIALRALLRDIF